MTLCRSETRRKQRRTNGLQMPWHPQQVIGWLVLAAFGACSFGILLPGLGPDLYPITLFVLGSLFFLHVVSHVAALLIDPADPQLRALATASRDGGGDPKTTVVPELDKSKHAHVIENGKCHLCNIYTSGHRTKHCGSCNKCVEKFDHHCKWLNHCVGARNYVAFIVSVVSAVLACLVIVLVSSAELLLYNADPADVERYLGPMFGSNETALRVHRLFSVSRLPVERNAFVTIASAQCALALIAMALLLHLCAFHVYISALGITTYEYIRNYRRYPEFDSRNSASAADGDRRPQPAGTGSRGERCARSVLAKLYASACCYYAASSSSSGRGRKRPSCGIHSNLNDAPRPPTDDVPERQSIEDQTSYGRAPSGSPRRETERRPAKCRYCLEKNSRMRSDGGDTFFVLGKRRKGLCCCCFQKPEPVFGGAAGDGSAMLRVKVPPSPFAVRRNRVIPAGGGDRLQRSVQADEWKSFDATKFPQPIAGHHRPMQKITLKELGQVLAFVEQQPSARRLRRKSGGGGGVAAAASAVNGSQIKHSKSSSNLSPIHESGLSNPSTPQLKNRYPQTRPCTWLSPSSHNPS